MKAYEYIISKQIQWAYRNSITLTGDKGNWGRKAYTQNLNDNLFKPFMLEIRNNFIQADGGELTGNPCKMQAVHSSSALGVNIFQYWKRIKISKTHFRVERNVWEEQISPSLSLV